MTDVTVSSPVASPIASPMASLVAAPGLPGSDVSDSGRLAVDDAVLAELRARLACGCAESADGSGPGDGGVRGVVGAAVGSLGDAAPLVDSGAIRSAGDDDLVWCAQAIQRAVNVLEGARSAVTAEVARRALCVRRGEASAAETLTNATGLSAALARRIERDAQVLGACAAAAELLERGEINADQATAVAGADVPHEVRSELCERAKHQSADQTRRTVRAAEAAWRLESETRRRARQRNARSAAMWIDPDVGMWHLRARFDPLTGDAVNRRFMAEIRRNWRSDKDLPETRRRSTQQRAADALTALITADSRPGRAAGPNGGAPSSARPDASPNRAAANQHMTAAAPASTGGNPAPAKGDRAAPARANDYPAGGSSTGGDPAEAWDAAGCDDTDPDWTAPSPTQMIVLTTLDNLRGASPPTNNDTAPKDATPTACDGLLPVAGAAAVTHNGTPLNTADARRIACDTQLIPVVMGAGSEILDIGRATRTVPAGIRRALIARDQHCVWPNCERAPIHCDAHHIQHWAHNGPTSLDNLALLCHTHHQRLHEHNLTLHPPSQPAPPGHGWTVTPASTPAPPHPERTPVRDHTRLNR